MRRTSLLVLLVACRATDAPRSEARGGGGASEAVDAARAALGDATSAGDGGAADVPPASTARGRRACLERHYVVPSAVVEDDGELKSTAERIARPDIEDVFAVRYERGAIVPVTDPERDPGRVRIEAVFDATYGESASAVSRALVPVRFAGTTVSFHERAAAALERVGQRLAPLVRQPPTKRFFAKLGGTFAARSIAGTDLRSAHSWGIAIDLDPSACEYWRDGPQPPKWKNRVPQEIVDAFEAEGFAWGGRWYHYDTMHFEYRPELLDPDPSCR